MKMFDEISDEDLLTTFQGINADLTASEQDRETARLMEIEFCKRALAFVDAGGLNPH